MMESRLEGWTSKRKEGVIVFRDTGSLYQGKVMKRGMAV